MSINTTTENNKSDFIIVNIMNNRNENNKSNVKPNVDTTNNNNNDVITNNNHIIKNNDANNNRENEENNNENICMHIIKEIYKLLFNKKFITYEDYELENNLIDNTAPLYELTLAEINKVIDSMTDITYNNSYFISLTIRYIANQKNQTNRKDFISFIKSKKKFIYYFAIAISILKSILIILIFISSIYSLYPKYSCTNTLLFEDKKTDLFLINNNKKYKVDKIYDITLILRIIYFILYDCVFIVYNLIFIIFFKKKGIPKFLIIIYQIIEYILVISISILTYAKEGNCISSKNGDFVLIKKNDELYKKMFYIFMDLIKFILK